MKKIFKSDKGQALVEFTLILPILLLLVLGMIEFGWLLYGKITLNSAVREGARVGAVLVTTEADRLAKVVDAIEDTTDLSSLTILTDQCTVTNEDNDVENVHNIVVVVKAEMEPIIGLYVKDDVSMSVVARMRRE